MGPGLPPDEPEAISDSGGTVASNDKNSNLFEGFVHDPCSNSKKQNPPSNNTPIDSNFNFRVTEVSTASEDQSAGKVQSNAKVLTHKSGINYPPPKFTTHQGLPAVILKKKDFMVKLATRYKYTLVGKFSNTMPKMELIRKSFILQTQLSGGAKIAHFQARHLYIDLDNEEDYINVWTKQRMYIEGQLMRIQAWTLPSPPRKKLQLSSLGSAFRNCHGTAIIRSF